MTRYGLPLPDNFDSYMAIEAAVIRFVHGRHAAVTDDYDDFVSANRTARRYKIDS